MFDNLIDERKKDIIQNVDSHGVVGARKYTM